MSIFEVITSTTTKHWQDANIVVMAVGHSGTTVLVRMLHELGWAKGDADKPYAEMDAARRVNAHYIKTGDFDYQKACDAFLGINKNGWVMKDPRLVITFPFWEEVFSKYLMEPIVLLHLERDLESVLQSYKNRKLVRNGVPFIFKHTVEDLFQKARDRYNMYDGPKLSIRYEDLRKAAALFDTSRG
jgi:hypothetical protein